MVMAACVVAFAIPASAGPVAATNWPNSPVLHTSKQRVNDLQPSFSSNLRGGVATAGNTLETCPGNLPHVSANPGAEPCRSTDNNGENMMYVNVDPGNGRFNSSTANLTIPPGSTVVRAYLYWAADLSRGVSASVGGSREGRGEPAPGGNTPVGETPLQENPLTSAGYNTEYGTVEFRAGANAGYTTVNAFDHPETSRWDSTPSWFAASPATRPPDGSSPGWAYQVRADVTSQLQDAVAAQPAGDVSIPITVANVQAGTGFNRYAGWNIVVVWASPTAQFRNITLFDGFAFVQVQTSQHLVLGPLDATGFRTPASGDLNAHLAVWATEGDYTLVGDHLLFGNLTNNCDTLTRQSDTSRPDNNFFNSGITNGGVNVAGRDPGFINQLGFDIATLDVPESLIAYNATGASVCLGTTSDTYFFGGLVFDTLIKAPNLKIAKNVDKSHANLGDKVTYTTTVTNPQRTGTELQQLGPTDTAINLVVTDHLPSGLDFGQFTVNPGGVCSYDAASREIRCNVGRLAADDQFSFSFEATVNAVAEGNGDAQLPNFACFEANSQDQPDVPFTGCDPGVVIVPPPTPGHEPADLGVVKTVDHEIVGPGNTLTWQVVGTNHGPAASTGFTLADELPPGVEFVSATHSPELTCTTPPVGSSGAITCTAPNSVPAQPAAGSSLTLTITATVPATTANGTLLLNVATVSGDQPEPVPDPNPNRDETLTRVVVPDKPPPRPFSRTPSPRTRATPRLRRRNRPCIRRPSLPTQPRPCSP
jgi:large repetitive protein